MQKETRGAVEETSGVMLLVLGWFYGVGVAETCWRALIGEWKKYNVDRTCLQTKSWAKV